MNLRLLAALPAALLTASAVAVPPPLNLVSVNPDVASGFLDIHYNSTTGAFTVSGPAQNVNLPPTVPVNNGTFSLNMFIDNNGNPFGVASLLIVGDIGSGIQTLFSSSQLLNFGVGAVSKFEFLFLQDASPGALAPAGTNLGTILTDVNMAFPGGVPDFDDSFTNEIAPGFGTGSADTFVPTPGAGALLAGAGLLGLKRRRRA